MKDTLLEYLNDGCNVFLTGGAGTGKTTLVKSIIEAYEHESKKIAKLASTGMAATLIGGQTLHSFLDIGICNSINELDNSSKSKLTKKLKNIIASIHLIIIDEISMVSASLFDLIIYRLAQADFQGSLLVVGDFLQLPPVVKNSFQVNFAFESSTWSNSDFITIELDKNYRTQDLDFISVLNDIRYGKVDENAAGMLESFVRPFNEELKNFTLLFGKNVSAEEHNKRQLSYISSDLHVKECEIIIHDKKVSDNDIERFFKDSRIVRVLELKIGVPILFTKNAWNNYNGERGVVVKVDEQYVYVQKSEGVIVKLEQVAEHKTIWVENAEKESEEKRLFSVYQYPITLAFAITIHKSQGMSIKDLIIETNEIFAPSQFYVALSRATSKERLILIQPRRSWKSLVFVNQKAINFTLENKLRD